MWTEIISIIVAYLGVFVGLVLSRIAKEEVHEGEKEFKKLEYLMRLIIFVFFIFTISSSLTDKLIFAAIVFVFAMIVKSNYYVFGFMLGVNPSLAMCSLIFIYGFPYGTILNKHSWKAVLKKTWPFLLCAAVGLGLKLIIF